MKIRNDQFKNTSDFDGRKGSATLNMDRLSLFMDNMISNYNFPELAVLREWISNAHDAHVASGIKRPVKVTLPSQLNPALVVQDFGAGMTPEFVEGVYLDFGSSSKSDSNNEIGGFGIGGKSALAIAPQYTMTTIANGLKSIYIFERSPKGGVDFKNPIHNIPTDEPNGVTVQVAVDRVGEFTEVNLNRVLCGWSNADIELNTGKKFFSIPDNGTLVSYELDLTDYTKSDEPDIRAEQGYVLHGAFDLSGDTKGLNTALGLGWNEHVVLVGPVAYMFQPEITTGKILKDHMVASVNIGDVSFPSSREVIEPTRTNRSIVGKCFERLVDEADKLLQEKANSLADRKMALSLYRSPLAQNRRDMKITFQGDVIPTHFTPETGDTIFEYHQLGNWRGVKGYKLAEQLFGADSSFKLAIQTLVIVDDDSKPQSIRNAIRLRHTDLEDKPQDLGGYLVISKSPSEWLKAAAKFQIKSSELAAEAKAIRKKQRDEAAAAAAAGTPLVSTAPVRKTRKDRLGEYNAHWLNFVRSAEGTLEVTSERSDLMDFYTNHFDPKKTLVLTTNEDSYSPSDFSQYFQRFSVEPKDAQFLDVSTGSKIETLRILLGDEVEIVGIAKWLEANFANLATFKGRSPKEIAKELPFSMDSSAQSLLLDIGVDTLHPKYAEIMESHREYEEAQQQLSLGNYYYTEAARLMRSVLTKFENAEVKDRPEFFFLQSIGYYRRSLLIDSERAAIRQTLNQMVENWLDNLALEEIEAEEEAAEVAKLSAKDSGALVAAASN